MIFNGELQAEDATAYFLDNYDGNIFYPAKESTVEKSKALITDYFDSLSLDWLDDYEILGVEKKVEFELGGHRFVGYIDLLLRNKKTGEIVVVDHKSSEYPLKQDGLVKKNSKDHFDAYKRQMHLYSYAVKLEYGVFPRWIVWNHFKANKYVKIPFVESEYIKSIRWFGSSIKKIMAEEEYKPTKSYFYCNNLCNFRNSCEFAKEDKKNFRRH